MKILMIGATGYIGGTVARALEQAGHTVVPLVRTAWLKPVAGARPSGLILSRLMTARLLRRR